MPRELKEEIVSLRVSKRVRELMVRGAKKHKMGLADYLAYAVRFELAMGGDVDVFKEVGAEIRDRIFGGIVPALQRAPR